MGELTGRQRRYLRGLGNTRAAATAIGRAGLTPGALANVSRMLEQHELVKVRVPPAAAAERKALTEALARGAGAALVGGAGRTVLLYRRSDTLPPEKRIALPA